MVHSTGTPDPLRDVDIVETEMLLADLETAERAKARWSNTVRTGTGEGKRELAAYTRAVEGLSAGIPLRALELHNDEERILTEARQREFISAPG